MSESTYKIVGDLQAEDFIPHFVSRIAAQCKQKKNQFRGIRAAKGVVIIQNKRAKHRIFMFFGMEEHYRVPIVRIAVENNTSAKWAVFSFPVFSFLGLFVIAKLSGGAMLALFLGIIVGIIGSFVVFSLARKMSRQQKPSFTITHLQKQYFTLVENVVSSLGLKLEPADETNIAGLDIPHNRTNLSVSPAEALEFGDEKAWTNVMQQAVFAVPER